MGLWKPGTVAGVTATMIHAVCKQAFEDHYRGVEFTGPMLPPKDMDVNELVSLPEEGEGDSTFDRCSFGYWAGERFTMNGVTYCLAQFIGSKWRISRVLPNDDTQHESEYLSDADLAEILTAENGPHPNPYVARIEVTYAKRGARAGYGIRKDGTFDLWYD